MSDAYVYTIPNTPFWKTRTIIQDYFHWQKRKTLFFIQQINILILHCLLMKRWQFLQFYFMYLIEEWRIPLCQLKRLIHSYSSFPNELQMANKKSYSKLPIETATLFLKWHYTNNMRHIHMSTVKIGRCSFRQTAKLLGFTIMNSLNQLFCVKWCP